MRRFSLSLLVPREDLWPMNVCVSLLLERMTTKYSLLKVVYLQKEVLDLLDSSTPFHACAIEWWREHDTSTTWKILKPLLRNDLAWDSDPYFSHQRLLIRSFFLSKYRVSAHAWFRRWLLFKQAFGIGNFSHEQNYGTNKESRKIVNE